MSAHLIVFARNPAPGAVKTRLQPRYTPEQAADISRAFILDTLENARRVPADRYLLAYAPAGAEAEVRRLSGPGWDLRLQPEADLGGRMVDAAAQSFAQGASRVVLIGTDIPTLPAAHIRQAFDLLSEKDVAIGPSADGGYYLIGLSRPMWAVFRDIAWSTGRVFAQTLDRVEAAALSLGLVPPWYDVDTPEGLDFLLAHARALKRACHPPLLGHTMACLATLT